MRGAEPGNASDRLRERGRVARPARAARLLALLLVLAACATGPARPRETLRVGTSGDYAPFSHGDPGAPDGLAGFDVELVRRFAAARGARVEWVRFRWPSLAEDLRAGRFDVAVGGVTVRPERSALGRFTRPLAEAGAVVLVRGGASARAPADLGAGARVAVNAGGHLERVARALFPDARIEAVPDNAAVPGLLARGEVDAAVSDAVEAPRWAAQVPGARVLGPFTRDRKAWWVRADRPELARALDAWLAAREADGTLARLRAERLGLPDAPRSAAPLPALLSALRERLELMPLVAEAKRASGAPVEDPAREARVVEDAVAAARAAAAARGLEPPPDDAVRTLFRAQIEAGKAVQAAVLAGPPTPAPALDLAAELRPALTDLGARIAALLVELPGGLPAAALLRGVEEELSLPGVSAAHRAALADALAAVAPR
jgi:cyclohexadienyl dehydratase